jgi:hypothetical protein
MISGLGRGVARTPARDAALAMTLICSAQFVLQLARQQPQPGAPPVTPAEAQLRKC